MLFDYIGSGVLANEKIVRLTEMTELLVSNLTSLGAEEIKLSTKTHIRRNLQAEFGFENLLETTSAFLIPVNFTPLRVAKYITTLLLEKTGQCKPVFSGAQIYTELLLTFAKLFKEHKTRYHGLHVLQMSLRAQ